MTDELEDQMEAKTEELVEGRQGREAVLEATELAQIDPKDAIVWFVKGKAHYIDSQFDDALTCFSKAAEIEKENPQVWHMMGYALISLNRLDEAERKGQSVALCTVTRASEQTRPSTHPDPRRKPFGKAWQRTSVQSRTSIHRCKPVPRCRVTHRRKIDL